MRRTKLSGVETCINTGRHFERDARLSWPICDPKAVVPWGLSIISWISALERTFPRSPQSQEWTSRLDAPYARPFFSATPDVPSRASNFAATSSRLTPPAASTTSQW